MVLNPFNPHLYKAKQHWFGFYYGLCHFLLADFAQFGVSFVFTNYYLPFFIVNISPSFSASFCLWTWDTQGWLAYVCNFLQNPFRQLTFHRLTVVIQEHGLEMHVSCTLKKKLLLYILVEWIYIYNILYISLCIKKT